MWYVEYELKKRKSAILSHASSFENWNKGNPTLFLLIPHISASTHIFIEPHGWLIMLTMGSVYIFVLRKDITCKCIAMLIVFVSIDFSFIMFIFFYHELRRFVWLYKFSIENWIWLLQLHRKWAIEEWLCSTQKTVLYSFIDFQSKAWVYTYPCASFYKHTWKHTCAEDKVRERTQVEGVWLISSSSVYRDKTRRVKAVK